MPNYLYRCECGETKELSHSIAVEPEVRCDRCNLTMTRQPQTMTVTFKGTGWGHQ